jgi:hypothetical protein
VSDAVPPEVSMIPPSEPAYNAECEQATGSSNDVVYVGYTPGYTYSYPYYGTVVYGTGFYYAPYVSPLAYYPQPVTYGVGVDYDPYAGWTVGFAYTTAFLAAGVTFGVYGGWYGPWGYPPYPPPIYMPPYWGYPGWGYPGWGYPGWGYPCCYGGGGLPGYPGNRPGNGINRPNNDLPNSPGRPGGPTTLPANASRPTPYTNNMYRQGANADRTRPSTQPGGGLATNRPNNVVAGQNGNVYRNNGGNWQSRQGSQWQNGTGPSQVNRDYQARQQGNQQMQNYNRAQTGGTSPRVGGGYRGGGGGRRR